MRNSFVCEEKTRASNYGWKYCVSTFRLPHKRLQTWAILFNQQKFQLREHIRQHIHSKPLMMTIMFERRCLVCFTNTIFSIKTFLIASYFISNCIFQVIVQLSSISIIQSPFFITLRICTSYKHWTLSPNSDFSLNLINYFFLLNSTPTIQSVHFDGNWILLVRFSISVIALNACEWIGISC